MTSSPKRRGVPFSISLVTLMLVVVGLLSAALLLLGWQATSTLEEANIDLRMAALDESVTGWLSSNIRSTVDVQQALAVTPAFSRRAGPSDNTSENAANGVEARRQLAILLDHHPVMAAAYAGYADGSFDYVGRIAELPEALRRELNVPGSAVLFARSLAGGEGARPERWFFLAADGSALSEASRSLDFDPRNRPWYKEANATSRSIITEPYAFAVSGTQGVSVATQIGRHEGAIAFDFTLDALSQVTAGHKPARGAIVMVATDAGNILADSANCSVGDPACVPADPAMRELLRRELADVSHHSDRRLDIRLRVGGMDWEMLVDPMPAVFNERFYVGAAVPIAEITAESRRLLLVSGSTAAVCILLAVLAVLAGAVFMSRAIGRIALKTDSIRDLDFTDRTPIVSRIREVQQLSDAVERMRDGLEIFGRYVAKNLVRQIMRSPETAGVGGAQRQVTVMFSDIESFSRISEGLSPQVLTGRLSRYFDALTAPISAGHGTIDKFIGDSIMAFWNAPEPDEQHVENACRAALGAATASQDLVEKWQRRDRPVFRTRFGLHTGLAVIGNVGARDRINYTLVGTIVNQASRIEGLNKVYGTHILASGEVVALTHELFTWRFIERVIPAGTDDPLDLFELVAEGQGGADDPFLAVWERAQSAYANGAIPEASALFEEAMRLRPGDGPAGVLLGRCRQWLDTPPPSPWTATWRFETK